MTEGYLAYIDLLGRPWEKDARGPQSFDCLGLFLEMQRRLGRPLRDYTVAPGQLALAKASGDWERVERGEFGDGVLLDAEDGLHIGVVVAPGRMLHTRAGTGVVVESYEQQPWCNRLRGIYRWKS